MGEPNHHQGMKRERPEPDGIGDEEVKEGGPPSQRSRPTTTRSFVGGQTGQHYGNNAQFQFQQQQQQQQHAVSLLQQQCNQLLGGGGGPPLHAMIQQQSAPGPPGGVFNSSSFPGGGIPQQPPPPQVGGGGVVESNNNTNNNAAAQAALRQLLSAPAQMQLNLSQAPAQPQLDGNITINVNPSMLLQLLALQQNQAAPVVQQQGMRVTAAPPNNAAAAAAAASAAAAVGWGPAGGAAAAANPFGAATAGLLMNQPSVALGAAGGTGPPPAGGGVVAAAAAPVVAGAAANAAAAAAARTASSSVGGGTDPGNVPPSPHSVTGRQPKRIYTDMDAGRLTPYQCLARKQLEYFEADQSKVHEGAQGRNKAIVLGQVGIRCIHCSQLKRKEKAPASAFYPSKLHGLYQSAQNIINSHLAKDCTKVPADVREQLLSLGNRKSAPGGGKAYWAEAAREAGVFEDTHGLRFSRKGQASSASSVPASSGASGLGVNASSSSSSSAGVGGGPRGLHHHTRPSGQRQLEP